MALLDGLKGGQGFYWGAMPMPYEKMQRPDPIALPAGGRGSTTAASTAKPVEALSGDAANHERMKPLYEQADQIFMAEKMGEKVSPEQLKWANEVRVAKASNEAMLVKNNHNYNQTVGSEAYRENLDQYMLDEKGNRSLKEDGSGYITVADFYSDMNVKGGGVGDNLRIQPTKFSQLYNAKTFHDEVDDIFKQAEGHYNDSFTSRIGINSGIAFNNSEKQLLTRYSNRERTNKLNLNYAEGMAMSRILSDKNMYGGMKQALFQAIDLGMTIPAGFFSDEKQKARKDDLFRVGEQAYIKANDDDLFEFMEHHLKSQTATRLNNEIDARFYDTVISGTGGDDNSDSKLPRLFYMDRNDDMVVGEGYHDVIDFGPLSKGQKINTKQAIFGLVEGSLGAYQESYSQAVAKVNENISSIYDSFADANGIKSENMDDGQKMIARNTAIAQETKENFLGKGIMQEYFKKKSEEESKVPQKEKTFWEDLFTGGAITLSGDANVAALVDPQYKVTEERNIGEVSTMGGFLGDMTINDFWKSSREVVVYKLIEDDLKGTEFAKDKGNGKVQLGTGNRVQILGTEFTYNDLKVEGANIYFIDPQAAISNFKMGGDVITGLKGSILMPANKSSLDKLNLNIEDGKGKKVNVGEYSIKKTGIRKVELTQELYDELGLTPSSGYIVGKKVFIIPSTFDGTQTLSQAMAYNPGTNLNQNYNSVKKNQPNYVNILQSVMSKGEAAQ